MAFSLLFLLCSLHKAIKVSIFKIGSFSEESICNSFFSSCAPIQIKLQAESSLEYKILEIFILYGVRDLTSS